MTEKKQKNGCPNKQMCVKVGETRTSAKRCCHIKADIFEQSLMVEVRIGQLLLLHYSNSDGYLGLKNNSSTNTNVFRGGGLKQNTIHVKIVK